MTAATGLGTTSLGAVGGARGTAAGALRVIIEFLTQYDPKAIQQAAGDLKKFQTQGTAIQNDLDKKQRASANLSIKLAQTEAIIKSKFNRTQQREVQRIIQLRGTGNAQDLANARAQARVLQQATNLQGKQFSQFRTYFADKERSKALEADITKLQSKQADNTKQQVTAQKTLTTLEAVRGRVVPKLAGLAIGAVGGIIGGAVLGVGFAAADAIIAQIGEHLQDLIDPGRHARDAIADLGAEINKIAESKGIDTLQATSDYLEQIGVHADDATKAIIAKTAADQAATDEIAKQKELVDLLAHSDAQRIKNIQDLTDILRSQGRLPSQTNPLTPTQNPFFRGGPLAQNELDQQNSAQRDLNFATDQYNQLIAEKAARDEAARVAAIALTTELNNQAQAQKLLNSLFSVIGEQQAATLAGAANTRLGKLQAKRDALTGGAGGPSAAQTALQDRIDKLQKARAEQEYGDQLRQNSDERELLLLRQRLKLLGENINLEKYSGKFLVEAIDAKIAAIEKEGQVQDRLNKLQDIERAGAQADKLRRSQGESIADFLERRAEANQQVLRDSADLARQDRITTLEAQREKVQDQLDLEQNLADRKKLIADHAYQQQLQNLQDQLKAQQKADDTALKAKQKALDKQIQAEKDAAANATKAINAEYLQRINDAITAADTLSSLARITGAIQGLAQAKGYIEALVQAGLLTAQQGADLLAGINQTINAYEVQKNRIFPDFGPRTQQPGRGGTPDVHAAQGGVFPLRNSMSPFGQNVRVGEQGTELGIVLSHSVVKALRNSQGATATFGDINVNIDRRNPYTERAMVQRAVSDALREAI